GSRARRSRPRSARGALARAGLARRARAAGRGRPASAGAEATAPRIGTRRGRTAAGACHPGTIPGPAPRRGTSRGRRLARLRARGRAGVRKRRAARPSRDAPTHAERNRARTGGCGGQRPAGGRARRGRGTGGGRRDRLAARRGVLARVAARVLLVRLRVRRRVQQGEESDAIGAPRTLALGQAAALVGAMQAGYSAAQIITVFEAPPAPDAQSVTVSAIGALVAAA